MYLVRTELVVRLGHAADFESLERQLAEATKRYPGYMGRTLLHSYSHPSKYAITQRFENVEAAWAFSKSEAFTSIMKRAPDHTAKVVQQEGYDVVLEIAQRPMPPFVGCEIVVDEVLTGAEVIPSFELTLGQLFELRKQHAKGFGSNRLHRSAGRLGRYLVIQGYTDLDAASRANTSPEVQAFIRQHPASAYTSEKVQPEAYAVLHRL